MFVISNQDFEKAVNNSTPKLLSECCIGDIFTLKHYETINVKNSSGSFCFGVTTDMQFKVEIKNSRTIYCSAVNVPNFGTKFKGFKFKPTTPITYLYSNYLREDTEPIGNYSDSFKK